VGNLRDLAAADHRLIVEDVTGGFGRELTFIDPDGKTAVINGFWNDIGQALDPMTGSMVAATVAFVRVTLGALRAAGLGIPVGVAEKDRMCWTVEYVDMGGRKHRCKISEVRKDRSIDAVDCYLTTFKA
jgi:hypothetical protein